MDGRSLMIEKISDEGWEQEKFCKHPEHNVPAHLYLKPGRYKHTCSGCGKETIFTVAGAMM